MIAIACLAGRAEADRAVRVVTRGAPFLATDLESALRVRLPPAGAEVTVQVIGVGDRVDVAVGDTTREIDLGGRSGVEAARLVALEIVDLALDDLAEVPRDRPRHADISVGLLGSATAWNGTLAGATLDVAVARRGWLVALEVTGQQDATGELQTRSVPIRLSAGTRIDLLELRGGVVIAPTWVETGAGDSLVNLGLAASARLRVDLSPRVKLVAAIGADAYATQTSYVLGGEMITTPWVAPWIGGGLEVTP